MLCYSTHNPLKLEFPPWFELLWHFFPHEILERTRSTCGNLTPASLCLGMAKTVVLGSRICLNHYYQQESGQEARKYPLVHIEAGSS